MTSVPGVFAAGDMSRGQSLVVWAIRSCGARSRARVGGMTGQRETPSGDRGEVPPPRRRPDRSRGQGRRRRSVPLREPELLRTFGMTEQELLGRTFMPLVHEEAASRRRGRWRPCQRHACYLEQRALTVAGWRWIGWADTAVLDGAGRVVGDRRHRGRDVTDRREGRGIPPHAPEARHDRAARRPVWRTSSTTSSPESSEPPELRRPSHDRAARDRRGLRIGGPAHLAPLPRVRAEGDGALGAVVESAARSTRSRASSATASIGGSTSLPIRPGPCPCAEPDRLHAAILNLALNARMPCQAEGRSRSSSTSWTSTRPAARRCRSTSPGPVRPAPRRRHRRGAQRGRARAPVRAVFTTKEVGKGTGLGLAEVYGTVRAHHGAVVVESREREGTAVTVWLPACDAEASAVSDVSARSTTVEPLRVLVADDDANVRRTLALLLRGEGHAVVECAGGREAIERFARDWREIDVVILDLMMPDLGGADVLARLRAANPRARVIVSSGYGRRCLGLPPTSLLHHTPAAPRLPRRPPSSQALQLPVPAPLVLRAPRVVVPASRATARRGRSRPCARRTGPAAAWCGSARRASGSPGSRRCRSRRRCASASPAR